MARNKMATTTLKRGFKFIIRMDSERWAKICWVKNEMATEWGREMERRMSGLGREWRGVIEGNEEGDMIKKVEELLRIDNTEGLGKDGQLDILSLL